MVGWHHRLNGHEFQQALGVDDGHVSHACCSPCGHKKSDMIGQLNNNKMVSELKRSTVSVTFKRVESHALGVTGNNDRPVQRDTLGLNTSWVCFPGK